MPHESQTHTRSFVRIGGRWQWAGESWRLRERGDDVLHGHAGWTIYAPAAPTAKRSSRCGCAPRRADARRVRSIERPRRDGGRSDRGTSSRPLCERASVRGPRSARRCSVAIRTHQLAAPRVVLPAPRSRLPAQSVRRARRRDRRSVVTSAWKALPVLLTMGFSRGAVARRKPAKQPCTQLGPVVNLREEREVAAASRAAPLRRVVVHTRWTPASSTLTVCALQVSVWASVTAPDHRRVKSSAINILRDSSVHSPCAPW